MKVLYQKDEADRSIGPAEVFLLDALVNIHLLVPLQGISLEVHG